MPAIYQHDPFLFLQAILSPHSAWIEAAWIAVTIACEGWVMAAIALLFVLSQTRRLRGLVRATVPAFAVLLVSGLIARGLKEIVRTPRPLSVLDPAQVHVLLAPLRGYSAFPSGHSASAAALATWALLRFGRPAWPLLVLALLGGLSRVAVGAHWTVDVLGGWTIGVLSALAVHSLELHLARRRAAGGENQIRSP